MKLSEIVNLPDQSYVIDNSKLRIYQDCHRQFFFEHILGMRREHPSSHLVFGSAFHLGMSHIMENWERIRAGENYAGIVRTANDLFMAEYRATFGVETDAIMKGKAPCAVILAFINYIERYKFTDTFKILYTEVAGRVPIDIKNGIMRVLYYRLDTIVEDSDGVYILEHKTAGGELDDAWAKQFYLSHQISLYTHVLQCMFPRGKVWGAKVNGISFKHTIKDGYKQTFQRVPVRKTPLMMEAWLSDISQELDALEDDLAALKEVDSSDCIMRPFRRNPESCTKYFGCAYLDFCQAWANPLQYAHLQQPGFKAEWWDPRDYEKHAKIIKEL
jgi:hypothetical protein